MDKIDAGELKKQIEEALNACVQDIKRQDDLPEARQVFVTIKLSPEGDGQVAINYEVYAKLAKRKGEETAHFDKAGNLKLGAVLESQRLPLGDK